MKLSTVFVACLALVVWFIPAAPARGEPAGSWSPGKAWTYDMSLDALAAQGGVDTQVVQSARVKFEVQSVDEAGVREIVATVDRLTAVWRDAEGQVEFSWTRQEDPTLEKAATGNTEFLAICKAVAASSVRLQVGPEGDIASVGGLDGAVEAASISKRFGLGGLVLFSPAQARMAFAPIFQGDGAAARKAAGAGWQTTRAVPLGPAGQIDFVTEWVVTGVAADVLSYTGQESATLMRPSVPDTAEPSATISAHEGRTEGQWSIAEGLLLRRTQTRSMATQWKLGELSFQQDQRVKQTAELVR